MTVIMAAMYTPKNFVETRAEVVAGLIRAHPLATLVGVTGRGLNAEHVPILMDGSRGERGVLEGHVARANPVWREVGEGSEVLAIFHGPESYITPNWYASKAEHGEVVPTWNYMVVHVTGRIRWIEDARCLRGLVERLTNAMEGDREKPWRVDDAPEGFVRGLLGAIVGFEIDVVSVVGKSKLSQNREERDRAGVVEGLRGEAGEAAAEMVRKMDE